MPNTPDLPIPKQDQPDNEDLAVNLIRQKVDYLYSKNEPSVVAEEAEIETKGAQSKHQKFLKTLVSSGKNMAQIQTTWHEYYQELDEQDKKQVWQEFYDNYSGQTNTTKPADRHVNPHRSAHIPKHFTPRHLIGQFEPTTDSPHSHRSTKQIKKRLIKTVSANGKLKAKHHLKSLLFGFGVGLFVILIFMFGFFNERLIGPLISPSKNLTNTPIITNPNITTTSDMLPKIIIPKINAEAPVVYYVNTIADKDIDSGLENGVVHYPTTPLPGQNGNLVIVGHSANNIFNRGKYKFAFALLNRLQEGDTFMIQYSGQIFTYRVYVNKIVEATDVSVLGPTDKAATATLITCYPPGTNWKRTVVIGEQISPSITNNTVAANTSSDQTPSLVPGNSISLFQRLFGWIWN